MRGLAGLCLWGGLERTRGQPREWRGLDGQELGEGKLWRLEGEGREAGQGARGRPGGSCGTALEVKWVALDWCLSGEWGLRSWPWSSSGDRALRGQFLGGCVWKERVVWK